MLKLFIFLSLLNTKKLQNQLKKRYSLLQLISDFLDCNLMAVVLH